MSVGDKQVTVVINQLMVDYNEAWTKLAESDRAPCILCAKPTANEEQEYCEKCRKLRRRVAQELFEDFPLREIEGYYLLPMSEWAL